MLSVASKRVVRRTDYRWRAASDPRQPSTIEIEENKLDLRNVREALSDLLDETLPFSCLSNHVCCVLLTSKFGLLLVPASLPIEGLCQERGIQRIIFASMEAAGVCLSQREPGDTPELQNRVSVARYLLYHVRKSRLAYYPGGSGGGIEWESQACNDAESAAIIAASRAERLADSIRPSVRVSDLLDCLASGEAGNVVNMASVVDAPTWGTMLKDASQGRQHPGEGLELYLCERLLPLLDAGIAALCEYIEKLQADMHQFQVHLHGKQREERQHLVNHEGLPAHEKPECPKLLLGQGLHERFDPLVWLGQHLIRQGKAAAAFAKAQSVSSQNKREVISTKEDVRGEHIRLCELPVYEFIAEEVRDERGWRALEALQPQTEFLYQQIKLSSTPEVHEEMSEGQRGEQQSEELPHGPAQFPAENLAILLQAIDSAWGLPKSSGFLAAVMGDVENAEEHGEPAHPSASKSKERKDSNFLSSSDRLQERSILGACTTVTLEVANADNVAFPEVWRFLARCLEACVPLKEQVFARILNISTGNISCCSSEAKQKEQLPAEA